MKTDNILLIVAIVAVAVSIIGAGITYSYITAFKSKITGFAASSGTVNLSIESTASINFTTDIINWGSGRVSAGWPNATLNTAGGANNVTNGNWTGNTAGLVVENIGNLNITLNISFGTDATGLLGGTNPYYEYNVTNNEGSSCLNATGGTDALSLGTFKSANTTTQLVCGRMPFSDSGTFNDAIRIDMRLVVPSDSKVGAIGDTVTATFSGA